MSHPPTATEFDVGMMRRAIGLAMRGRGSVEPNPSVGCVIVKGGRVIGEGYTRPFGGAHAEPTAIANCVESPVGGTAYVTLEPCCHTRKKTPPCVPVVVGAGIKRVVIGCLDPNPEVNGRGVEALREAGVEVVGPVLEGECKQVIAPFIARVTLGRPYVTLKWAESADGRVAGAGGKRVQISNERSMREVHELRARCDAVLVGGGTLRNDGPLLTARGVEGARKSLAMVVTDVLAAVGVSKLYRERREELVVFGPVHGDEWMKEMGWGDVAYVGVGREAGGGLSLRDVVREAGERFGVTHLLVEAGPKLAAGFFLDNLVDRVWVFRSPKTIGDETAPAAARVPQAYVETGRVGLEGDVLTEWLNPGSGAFFAGVESADLVRVRGRG